MPWSPECFRTWEENSNVHRLVAKENIALEKWKRLSLAGEATDDFPFWYSVSIFFQRYMCFRLCAAAAAGSFSHPLFTVSSKSLSFKERHQGWDGTLDLHGCCCRWVLWLIVSWLALLFLAGKCVIVCCCLYIFCLYYLYFIIGALSAYSHCNFFCVFCLLLLLFFFCFYVLVGALFCCFHSVLVVLLTSKWPFPVTVILLSFFITIIIFYSILSFVSWSSDTATIFGTKSLVWFLLISQRKNHPIVCISTWTGA